MIYSTHNVQLPARVYDVDTMQEVRYAVEVDTATGVVRCFTEPLQVDHKGEAVCHTIRYRAIHPVFGGYRLPCLFHCYGRQ